MKKAVIMIKKVVLYIQRWNIFMMPYLVKNIVFSGLIFCVTSLIVNKGAFDEYYSTRTCLFAVLLCNIWQGIFNSIALFNDESSYTIDEINKFLPVKVYITANIILQSFLCLVEAILNTFIFTIMFDYDKTGIGGVVFYNRSLEYCLTFFLVLLSCDMLSMALGVAIKKINSIMTALPVILIIQFLFSDCLFELNEYVKTLSKLTTAKWGFNALGIISDLNTYAIIGGKIKPEFERTSSNLQHCWLMLGAIVVAFSLLSGLLLYFRINKEDD